MQKQSKPVAHHKKSEPRLMSGRAQGTCISRHRWDIAKALALATGPFLAGLGIGVPHLAVADEVASDPASAPRAPKREWAATVRWENDAFGGTDKFYTDGVYLSVSHTGPSWMDPVANWLPWGEGRRTVGYD